MNTTIPADFFTVEEQTNIDHANKFLAETPDPEHLKDTAFVDAVTGKIYYASTAWRGYRTIQMPNPQMKLIAIRLTDWDLYQLQKREGGGRWRTGISTRVEFPALPLKSAG